MTTNRARERLYDRCRGDAAFPTRNLCMLPIATGQRWHESHNPYLPRALGGLVDGIAHDRCNLDHARRHDVPLIAKNKRQRQKHIGAFKTKRPMLGSIASGVRKPFRGPPINRRTGQPWRPGA